MSKYKFKGEYIDKMMNRVYERSVKKGLIKDTDANYDIFMDMMNKMFVQDWSHRPKPKWKKLLLNESYQETTKK